MALVCKRRRESLIREGEPDLTPLIDCVFLLLIFFMVTTVFIHMRGLDVDLPTPSEATQQLEKKDINIAIDADGRVQLGGEAVSPELLAARISKAMEEAHNDNIIIHGHPDCEQEHVVRVVDAAKKVKVAGIAFVLRDDEVD